MKGAGQTRRGNSVFLVAPLKRTPGRFGRLTAEVESGAAKREGECFHVFTCVFSFTTGTYIYGCRAVSQIRSRV